jgi:hypothetical protein
MSPRTGQTSIATCDPCDAGMYCPSNGMHAGITCPPHYYCPAGTSDYTAFPCPPGTYSEVGGLYSAAQCMNCTVGHYCPGAMSPIPCPAGTYNPSAAGSSNASCLPCEAGYACPLAGMSYMTTPCSPGHYCLSGTLYPTQHPCPMGTYSDSTSLVAPSGARTVRPAIPAVLVLCLPLAMTAPWAATVRWAVSLVAISLVIPVRTPPPRTSPASQSALRACLAATAPVVLRRSLGRALQVTTAQLVPSPARSILAQLVRTAVPPTCSLLRSAQPAMRDTTASKARLLRRPARREPTLPTLAPDLPRAASAAPLVTIAVPAPLTRWSVEQANTPTSAIRLALPARVARTAAPTLRPTPRW